MISAARRSRMSEVTRAEDSVVGERSSGGVLLLLLPPPPLLLLLLLPLILPLYARPRM
jgi:hypothetical protein